MLHGIVNGLVGESRCVYAVFRNVQADSQPLSSRCSTNLYLLANNCRFLTLDKVVLHDFADEVMWRVCVSTIVGFLQPHDYINLD